MGKFFKALEKAEKENLNRPIRQPATDRVPSNAEPVAPPAKTKPAPAADRQQPAPDHGRSGKPPAVPPGEMQTAVHADPSPAITPSPLGVESVDQAVADRPAHQVARRLQPDDASSKLETVRPPVNSMSVPEADPNRKPDPMNVALVKPDPSPRTFSVRHLSPEPEVTPIELKSPEAVDSTAKKEVRVRYSKTRVQANDPEKLRENKIFSIFDDDIETTNQIKILRGQVLKKLKDIGGNSILVTSANPYEGKTFTSINLGVSIAKEFNRTVLIIDADIRKPTQHHTAFSTEFFSLKVDKGLIDYLNGDVEISDILINPGIDRLTLIPGGRPANNSSELLNSGRMEVMMSEIKSRYPSDRLVIVDGPAMLPYPDAMILSRYVDGVLPVVEVEKTSAEDLKKMMNLLKEVNILGVVLNKNRG
ncbi:polysaccharide biosynthesis tyrosine autokinase [uncultured Desulfosarcina sp.]|uniref:polysaccharide biosynthesis tyrosine autokinase n=1 Tax=uncultured Desulfosarcina sp. TaxID=218289 RepID=UPI0029C6596A|nr:polysaccharide biosynthesis tyrosine autokinase [uncultured Desulfosarcina sp.]